MTSLEINSVFLQSSISSVTAIECGLLFYLALFCRLDLDFERSASHAQFIVACLGELLNLAKSKTGFRYGEDY